MNTVSLSNIVYTFIGYWICTVVALITVGYLIGRWQCLSEKVASSEKSFDVAKSTLKTK